MRFKNYHIFSYYTIPVFPLQPKKGWPCKIFHWQIPNFLAVALYMATTAMVDWNKVLEVCVLNRTTLPYTYSNTLHLLTLYGYYACLPLGYNIWNIALYNCCTSLHFKF